MVVLLSITIPNKSTYNHTFQPGYELYCPIRGRLADFTWIGPGGAGVSVITITRLSDGSLGIPPNLWCTWEYANVRQRCRALITELGLDWSIFEECTDSQYEKFLGVHGRALIAAYVIQKTL